VAAAARVAQVVAAAAQAVAAAGTTAAAIEAAAAAARVAQVAQVVQAAAVAGTAVTMIAASVTIEIAVPTAAVTTPQAAVPQAAAAAAATPRAGGVIMTTIEIVTATVTAIVTAIATGIVTAIMTATTTASLPAIVIVIEIGVIDIAAVLTSPRIMAITDIAPTPMSAPTRTACTRAPAMRAADKVMIRSAHTFTGVETTAFSPSSVSGTRTSWLTGMVFCAVMKKATTTIRITSATGAFIVSS